MKIPIIVPQTPYALVISKNSGINMHGIERFQPPKERTVTNSERLVDLNRKQHKINQI